MAQQQPTPAVPSSADMPVVSQLQAQKDAAQLVKDQYGFENGHIPQPPCMPHGYASNPANSLADGSGVRWVVVPTLHMAPAP